VPISPRLLHELREYWRADRPSNYLFPGKTDDVPLSSATVQKACKLAAALAGKLGNNAAARALLAKAQTRLASARQVNPADPQLIEKAAEIESLLREVRSTTDGS